MIVTQRSPRDRAAAGGRRHPPAGHAQPAGRGRPARARRLRGRRRARRRRREGPERADGRPRLQPADHLDCRSLPRTIVGCRSSSASSSPSRRPLRPGPAGDQGAADRGAARGDARRPAARARCGLSSASLLTAAGVAAIAARPVRRRRRQRGAASASPATLFGVITLAPLVARPLAALIGAPLRLRGVSGDLARQNAMRNPRRTASTAAALMIGLTLVVSMGVFASSLKASFGTVLGDSTTADLYLATSSVQAEGFSPVGAEVVKDVAGVDTVSATGFGRPGSPAAARRTPRSTRPPSSRSSRWTSRPARPRTSVPTGSWCDQGREGTSLARWADTVPAEFAATGKRDLTIVGDLRREGLSRQRLRHQPGDARGRVRETGSASSALVMIAPGADAGTGQGPDHRGAGRAPGRQGARPEGLRAGDQRCRRPAAGLRLGDAAARGRDRAARHRQHAGAVGVRADP